MILDLLKNNLHPNDEFIFGLADLTGLVDKKFGEFQYGISIGKKLDNRIVDAIENGPTMNYYNHYHQINKELAAHSAKIKDELKKIGIESIAIEPTVYPGSKELERPEYINHLTAELSHKMVATRAGLGWIGKTDLFISKKFGPRLRLVSLLINQKPEQISFPIETSSCGNCKICVESCPAKAATGKLWNIDVHRDKFFDAQKCKKKCAELAKNLLGIDKRICGICVSVCPIGKKESKNQDYAFR